MLAFNHRLRPPSKCASGRRMDSHAIRASKEFPNFRKVSDALWRGSQPTREGFRNLETAGVKTIVNLSLPKMTFPCFPAQS